MSLFIIPTSVSASLPRYSQRTTLDGQEFILRFAWNQRQARWYLSVSDADDVAVVLGIPLVLNWPLLRLVTDARRPLGELVVINEAGQAAPTLTTLGTDCLLYYYDAAEMAVAEDATTTAAAALPVIPGDGV